MRSYEKYSRVIICRSMKKAIGSLVLIGKIKIRVENTTCQKASRGVIFSKLKSFKKNWEMSMLNH